MCFEAALCIGTIEYDIEIQYAHLFRSVLDYSDDISLSERVLFPRFIYFF